MRAPEAVLGMGIPSASSFMNDESRLQVVAALSAYVIRLIRGLERLLSCVTVGPEEEKE